MNTNGGPAFPVREAERFNPENNETHAIEQHWGMSLRDWFAGKALLGIMADPEQTGSAGDISRAAYSLADTMLRARERGVEVKQGGEYRPHEELPDEHWHKIQTRPSLSWHPERGWEAACEMRGKMMYGKGKTIAQAQAALRAEWEGGAQ